MITKKYFLNLQHSPPIFILSVGQLILGNMVSALLKIIINLGILALIPLVATAQNKKPASANSGKKKKSIISSKERIAFKETLESRILKFLVSETSALAPDNKQTPTFSLDFEIDEKKLKADMASWDKKEQEKYNLRKSQIASDTKNLMDRIKGRGTASGAGKTGSTSSQGSKSKEVSFKFGSLNIKVDKAVTDEILSSGASGDQSSPVSLQIALPPISVAPFEYDLMNYLSKIVLELNIPSVFSDDVKGLLKQRLAKHFSFDTIKGYDEKWITIKSLPSPKGPSVSEWVGKILDSQNVTIPLLLLGLILGGVILLSAKMLTKGFSNIADGIHAMKPESEESSDAGGAEEIQVQEEDPKELVDDVELENEKAMSAQMLTSDTATIRQQVGDIIKEDPETASSSSAPRPLHRSAASPAPRSPRSAVRSP